MRSKTEQLDGRAPAVPAAARDLAASVPRAPLSTIVQRAIADPRSLGNAEVAQLQRTIGNAAVAQLLSRTERRANQTGLPDGLKSGVESLSGHAMDDVRVHYNSPKPAEVQALAYAQGAEIHLAPGQEKHLPHEAWHVVQQKQGRVKQTLRMHGVAINDDLGLEREADVAGTRAPQLSAPSRSAIDAPVASPLPARSSTVVQREQAKSPQELLAARITSSQEASGDVLASLPQGGSAALLWSDEQITAVALYNAAMSYRLGINEAALPGPYKAYADEARAQVAMTLLQVMKDKPDATELERSEWFETYLDRVIRDLKRDPDEAKRKASTIIATFKNDVVKKKFGHALAGEYLKRGIDKSVDYGAFLSDESLSGLENRRGTSRGVMAIVARLLAQARETDSREQRLYILARGIRDLDDRPLEVSDAEDALDMLSGYLRNQVSAIAFPHAAGDQSGVTWSLFGDVQNVDQGGQNPTPLAKEDPLLTTIREAWTIIEKAVSPEILRRVGPCGIRVYPSRFFRQQYSNHNIEIGSGRNSVSVILHEFGHHLEDMGNAPRWVRLHQILYERSNGEISSIFPVTIPKVISSEEQQYSATMPAWWYAGGWFGYSAKYYSSGGTEVVATTLEVFNQPERLYQIALRDPELFVAVLGMLRE